MQTTKGLSSAFAVLTAGLVLAGCAGVSSTAPATPTPMASPSLSDDAHDLAILSVEFSPPLNAHKPDESPTVLVAVDNRGRARERRVIVEARVTSVDGTLLSDDREVIDSLAPGEARVVRFSSLGMALGSRSYELGISVAAVDGERQVVNNRRSLLVDLESGVTMRP